ncbi:hypothetical protein [Formivibrio citricus]|uniref:hypothetical protein n=1 Tax=Formivibrio citricus TaxID=83765 RepID=UPI000B83F854|nr:hypothetical protein [Formivibrio citricus]
MNFGVAVQQAVGTLVIDIGRFDSQFDQLADFSCDAGGKDNALLDVVSQKLQLRTSQLPDHEPVVERDDSQVLLQSVKRQEELVAFLDLACNLGFGG